jgi:hypothetical protein
VHLYLNINIIKIKATKSKLISLASLSSLGYIPYYLYATNKDGILTLDNRDYSSTSNGLSLVSTAE